MKKITISLSTRSIDNALKEIELYKTKIHKTSANLVSFMSAYGEEAMINRLSHIDTGETLSSIYAKPTFVSKGICRGGIVAGGKTKWIEFGTGVAKNHSEHESKDHLRSKGVNISNIGQYDKGNGSNPNGWRYKDENGVWHWTKGIKANKYMYYTAQELRRKYKSWARQIFKNN